MSINLDVLQGQVQTRCDALTNASTPMQVLTASLEAFSVQAAGGTINRTVLDTQLQRITNAVDGATPDEQLILNAAVCKNPAGGSSGGGSSGLLGDLTFLPPGPSLVTKTDNSQHLMTGVIAPAGSYPAASAVETLKCIGRPIAAGLLNVDAIIWDSAHNGSGTIVVATSGGAMTSTDYGVTWTLSQASVWTGCCWTGTAFRISNTATTTSVNSRSSADGLTWSGNNGLAITGGIANNRTPCVWDGTKVLYFCMGTNIVGSSDAVGNLALANALPVTLDTTGMVWAKSGAVYVAHGGAVGSLRKTVNQATAWTNLSSGSAHNSVITIGNFTIAHVVTNAYNLRIAENDTGWFDRPINCPAGFIPQKLSTDGTNIILSLLRGTATTPFILYSPDLGVSWFMRSLSSNQSASGSFYYVKEKFIFGMNPTNTTTVSSIGRVFTDLASADYVGTLAPVFNDGVGTNVGSAQGYLKIKDAA